MKMTLYHLTGSARGRTQFIDAASVSFGTGGHCGITFDRAIDAAVYPLHAELTVENGHPIMRDRHPRYGCEAIVYVHGSHGPVDSYERMVIQKVKKVDRA